jgi:hypothetical protein
MPLQFRKPWKFAKKWPKPKAFFLNKIITWKTIKQMFKFVQKVTHKNFGAPEKIVNLKFSDIFYYAFFQFLSSLEMNKKSCGFLIIKNF